MTDQFFASQTADTYARTIFGPEARINRSVLIGEGAQIWVAADRHQRSGNETAAHTGVVLSPTTPAKPGSTAETMLDDLLAGGIPAPNDADVAAEPTGIEVTFTAQATGTYQIPLTVLGQDPAPLSEAAIVYVGDAHGDNYQILPLGDQTDVTTLFNLQETAMMPASQATPQNEVKEDARLRKAAAIKINVVADATYSLKIVLRDGADQGLGNALIVGAGVFLADTISSFTRGTRLLTRTGQTAIETLSVGDEVFTRDSGFQKIRWIGETVFQPPSSGGYADGQPVRIRAGALSDQVPVSDLVVSPQHRILVRSTIAHPLADTDQAMIAAKHLVGLPGINHVTDTAPIHYVHILLAKREVIYSEGVESEALLAGAQSTQH